MLSNDELERLITVKRSEIMKEKIVLGLSPPPPPPPTKPQDADKEQDDASPRSKNKRVKKVETKSEHDDTPSCEKKSDEDSFPVSHRLEDNIPAGLDRYIRRYLGLPVMLKAGEFSPNNPLIRAEIERSTGDVLLGLGEYERRRNTLRKIQQQQYREYLDQQAKLKQEAKERAERERKEREQKEREREERDIERQREEEERVRAREKERESQRRTAGYGTINVRGKVDTGVQVGVLGKPLSVAVQTDDSELYSLPHRTANKLTQAERELSPRTVDPHEERPVQPAPWNVKDWETKWNTPARDVSPKKVSISRRVSESEAGRPAVAYRPSILDVDGIQLRNQQAAKEAATRRQYYQEELRRQIQEQQRIRDERRNREKMLEQAEMRRLEEQLRMLKTAQDKELDRQARIDCKIKENTTEFDKQRSKLQKEIDTENQKLRSGHHTITRTSISNDTSKNGPKSNIPLYYPKVQDRSNEICTKRPPYSTNIPDNSIFSQNYDVDSYLRKNLNPSKEFLLANRLDGLSDNFDIEGIRNDGKNNNVETNKHDDFKFRKLKFQGDDGKTEFAANKYDIDNLRHLSDDEDDILKEKHAKHETTKSKFLNEESYGNPSKYDKSPAKYDTNPAKYEMSPPKNKKLIDNVDDFLEECPLNKYEPSRYRNYNEIKENTGQECVLNKYYSSKANDDEKNDDLIEKYPLSNYESSVRAFISMNKGKVSQNHPKEYEESSKDITKITEKAIIHDIPKEKSRTNDRKSFDDIPIPVLKHTPILKDQTEVASNLSKGMKLVEDKWKVPAVQKNILKSLPSEDGKNVSILTQLGSIRRQLQLEQLKLDNLLPKDSDD